ncbi:uncharacterized protein LOC5518517 [Nematostella vectensis]|uniref:uncharacterized protein LOC5518517 n=1 Tax=Nematostella vectensis TaxID=45351 RepID=UPI002077965C|nr:uncharacterized protein LOC5518517 [Nematostella vectensis]
MDRIQVADAHNKLRERAAVESLLSCSDDFKEDDFESFVVTSNWEEVARGWRNTEPNAFFLSSSEKRKKTKDKPRNSPPILEHDSQLAKVKKLASLITNSNTLNESNSKHGHVKVPSLAKFQNTGVLSYDVPCWRYIVDPKRYIYVKRPSVQQLRILTDRRTNATQTILLDSGGMITCQEANGGIVLLDPALSFDKHLVETLDVREEFRQRSGNRVPCKFEFSSVTQIQREDNKIKVVHTLSARPELSHCSGVCNMCRHRTQECKSDDNKSLNGSNSRTELKPLQKITPTQRRAADDSFTVGKLIMQQSKSKEHIPKSDASSSSCKESKSKKDSKSSPTHKAEPKLDWLPITRNTIAYPAYVQTMAGFDRISHARLPDRTLPTAAKPVSFPGHKTKARKLTLSEAANLVPKTSIIGDAINRLSKKLEQTKEKPLSISEPLLPSVSGTKLEVTASGICDT